MLLLPEKKATVQSITHTKMESKVKFKDYYAKYPTQRKASLKNLNFEIENGSLIGVIGTNLNLVIHKSIPY